MVGKISIYVIVMCYTNQRTRSFKSDLKTKSVANFVAKPRRKKKLWLKVNILDLNNVKKHSAKELYLPFILFNMHILENVRLLNSS